MLKKNKETEICTRKATKSSSYSILHKKDAGIASCTKKESGGGRVRRINVATNWTQKKGGGRQLTLHKGQIRYNCLYYGRQAHETKCVWRIKAVASLGF